MNDAITENDVRAIDAGTWQTLGAWRCVARLLHWACACHVIHWLLDSVSDAIRQAEATATMTPELFDSSFSSVTFQVSGSDGKMHDLVRNGENVTLTWENRTGQLLSWLRVAAADCLLADCCLRVLCLP